MHILHPCHQTLLSDAQVRLFPDGLDGPQLFDLAVDPFEEEGVHGLKAGERG